MSVRRCTVYDMEFAVSFVRLFLKPVGKRIQVLYIRDAFALERLDVQGVLN